MEAENVLKFYNLDDSQSIEKLKIAKKGNQS